MSFSLNFPLFMIVASLFSSVISTLLKGKQARILTLSLNFISIILNIILGIYVYSTNEEYTYLMGHFPSPWGNELKIGLIETIIITVFILVLFLCLLGGKKAINEFIKEDKRNLYYALCDLIQASLLVLVYTNDIFTSYVFVEIMMLSSVGILMIRDNGRTTAASIRYLIFALIGSGLFLFGIVFLYNITGNLLIPALNESVINLWNTNSYHIPLLVAMAFIVLGLAIKSGLFPFHFWMADTYGTAIPTSSGILSGIISKAYIFLLIKIILRVFTLDIYLQSNLNNVLFILGCIGIIVGSISAQRENNIFRMIAYSSASQIGYIYMGIGLGSKSALIAALLQIIVHSITKPLIFISAYELSNSEDGAKKFSNLKGSAYDNRFAGIAFLLGALSMIGIPLTAGFISKYLFGASAFESSIIKLVLTLITLIISTVLNTLYFMHTIVTIFNKKDVDNKHIKNNKGYIIAGSIFMFINIMIGTFGKYLIELIGKGINL